VLAGLVLLALVTVLVVTMFVDPNHFRGQIESAITQATGQPFDIEGDLEIAWFPWLALRMGPAQFGKPGGSENQPIVQWESARVGARLVPLLKGQLLIDTVRLDGPKIYLARGRDGRGNWEEMIAAFKAKGQSPAPPATTPARPGPQIEGFQIRNGTLLFVDELPGTATGEPADEARDGRPGNATGREGQPEAVGTAAPRRFMLTSWSLDVGEWRAGTTFPVKTEFVLHSGDTLLADEVALSARVHVSDDSNDIDLFGLELESRIHGGALPASGLAVELEVSRLAARLTPLDVAISELSARVADVKLTTSVQAGESGAAKTPYARGPIAVDVPSVRAFLKLLGVDIPLPLDPSTLGKMRLNSMVEWMDGAVTVNDINVEIDETRLNGQLSRTSGAAPVWTFALHGDKIGLSRYIAIEDKSKEPFELPVAALKALQVQGELTFDQAWLEDAQMKGVKLRLELEDGAVKTAASQ